MPSSSGSTTEEDTPKLPSVDTEYKEIPDRDFARLTPISRSARHAFHNLAVAMKESPQKYRWHRRFIYIRPHMEELDAGVDEQSTGGGELALASRPQSQGSAHTLPSSDEVEAELHQHSTSDKLVLPSRPQSRESAHTRPYLHEVESEINEQSTSDEPALSLRPQSPSTLHVCPNLEELDADIDKQPVSIELATSSRPQSPSMVYTGFWTLDMDLYPVRPHLGWVLGKGRWYRDDSQLNTATGGGVDILLTTDLQEPLLRGRHARLVNSLESDTFLVAADEKLRVGERQLDPTDVAGCGPGETVIAFGGLEYRLAFTNRDRSTYKAQIDQLSQFLHCQGARLRTFTDPASAGAEYSVMGKYYIRSSLAREATCWMCAAVDRGTGATVAVKKVVAVSSAMLDHARREISAMKKLSSGRSPLTVAKLIDSLVIESSNLAGATECFIISQPSLTRTLGDLLTWPALSMSSRLSLLEQMLEGLAYLHEEGCMHRDINPENILASESPLRAVIVNFGCATWERTSTDHTQGRLRYLAPEVLALKKGTAPPDATYDASADVWAMGLTAYELLRSTRVTLKRISRKVYSKELYPEMYKIYVYSEGEKGKWGVETLQNIFRWPAGSRTEARYAYEQSPKFKTERERR